MKTWQSLWSFLLMAAVLVLCAAPVGAADQEWAARQGVLDLRDWRPDRGGVIRLQGDWAVVWGRLLTPLEAMSPDVDWQATWMPGVWNGRPRGDGGFMTGFGEATFRLRLLLPPGAPELTLSVPQIKSASRLWIDGRLAASSGLLGTSRSTERPRLATRFATIPSGGGPVDLILEVSNHFHFEGGVGGSLELEAGDALRLDWQRRQLTYAGAFLSLIMLAAFIGALQWRRMSIASSFLILLLLVAALRLASTSELIQVFFPTIPMALSHRLEYLPIYLFWPIYFHLLDEIFPGCLHRWIGRVLLVIGGAGAVMVLTTEPAFFTRFRDVATSLLVVSALYFIVMLAVAAWRRRFGARLLGIGAAVFLFTVVHDGLMYAHVFESVDLVPFGTLFFMFAHSLLLGRRVIKALDDVRDLSSELVSLNEGLERQVEERTRALSDKSAMLERVLANLSHEVRTPLNAILGTVRVALRDHSFERLRTVESAGRHLVRLLDSILELSRWEARRTLPRPESTDPRRLLSEAVELMRIGAEEKGLSLDLSVAPDLAPLYRIDRLRLEQIAVNLIGNAVKFTDEGGITVELGERAADSGARHILLTVSDTGPGIPAAARERVFEAFQRMETERREGAGLGLAIVRALAESMGGGVSLGDRPGGGSVFTVWLPAPRVATDERAPRGGAGPRAVLLRPLEVLLVEDAQENQAVIVQYLAPGAHHVTCVVDGETAILLLARQRFDVVLLDMRLPGMDGMEVTRRIRAFPDTDAALVPIVAVTANASRENRAEYLDAGVDEVVPKPVDPDLLVDALMRQAPADAVAFVEVGEGEVAERLSVRPPAATLFADACREALAVLSADDLADDLACDPVADLERLSAITHRLKGSAATFGFPDLGDRAAALDEGLRRPAGGRAPELGELARQLRVEVEVALRNLQAATQSIREP